MLGITYCSFYRYIHKNTKLPQPGDETLAVLKTHPDVARIMAQFNVKIQNVSHFFAIIHRLLLLLFSFRDQSQLQRHHQ